MPSDCKLEIKRMIPDNTSPLYETALLSFESSGIDTAFATSFKRWTDGHENCSEVNGGGLAAKIDHKDNDKASVKS